LKLGTALAKLSVEVISSLRDSKLLLGVEAKLGLEGDDIVGLESWKTSAQLPLNK